jgi:DNA repair protein RecO (recombination protein O)
VSRAIRTRAVLLRSVEYGEADRILSLFTEAEGRVSAMARGARKSSRRFAGALEPFQIIEVELVPSSGELGRLSSARLVRAFPRLLADLRAMAAAGAAMELVRDVSAPRTAEPEGLPCIEALFERLALEEGAPEEALLAFRLRWLALSGLAIRVDACGRCGKRAPEGRAGLFDPGLGSVVCRECGGGPVHLSGPTRASMRQALGPEWATVRFEAEALREARDALDAFVARHVSRAIG